MIICTVKVVNERGLHVRPAARFVALTSEFQASISVHHGERSADGKSILGMMTLAAGCGARLDLRIEGDDAERMVNCMARVLASDLDVLSIDTTPRSPCR